MNAKRCTISALIGTIAVSWFSCAPGKKLPVTAGEMTDAPPHVPAESDNKITDYISQPGLPEAREETDTLWRLPDTSSPVFFSDYKNRVGFHLSSGSNDWLAIPNKRSPQGLPVLTLIRASDKKVRLRVFDAHIDAQLTGESELDSVLAYLYKIEPHAAPSSHTPYRVQVFRSSLNSAHHWALRLQSDSNLIVLYFEYKNQPADSPGILPGLNWSVEKGSGQNPPKRESEIFQSAIFNTLGLMEVQDSNYQKAMTYFEQAFRLDSGYIPHLINITAMHQALNKTPLGIQFLKSRPARVRSSSQLSGILGALYEEVLQYESARDWAQHALSLDPANDEWLINLSDALWQLGERVLSKNVLLGRYHKNPTFRLAVYLANTHLGLEEYHHAKRVLEKAHQTHQPSEKSVEYILMSLNGLKDHAGALNYLRNYSRHHKITAPMYVQKATAELNLKFYLPAEFSAKKALEINPSSPDAKNLLTRINTLMGGKTNLIITDPIAPLAMNTSQSSLQELADAYSKENTLSSSIVLLKRAALFKWLPGKKWKKTTQLLYYLPGRETLINFSELTFELNPSYSAFFVNHYRILDEHFNITDTRNSKDYYVTKIHNSTVHPENLLIHIPIKQRGKALYIDLLVTEESRQISLEFPYLKYQAKSAFPYFQNSHTIIQPPPDLNIHTYGEARIDTLPNSIQIDFLPSTHTTEEKFSPAYEEYGSGFSISTPKSWRQVGKEYLEYLKRTGIQADSVAFAVREQAQEILDNASSGASPLQSCFNYVRDAIAYNNYEFNLHALIPEKAEDVNTKKFGDCKGHALLLTQLLRACGIKANLCLVSLEHSGYASQPSIHQFNHMIVHVPNRGDSPGYFLDPTEKYQPFRQVPLSLQGKNTLILERGASRLASIPEITIPGEHEIRIKHLFQVQENREIKGIDTLFIKGKLAAEFREQIDKWEKLGKLETLISWLTQGYPGYWDGKLQITQETEIDKSLVLVFSYRRNFVPAEYQQGLKTFPKMELSFLRFPESDNRKTPVHFPVQVGVSSEWHINLPEKYSLTSEYQQKTDSRSHLNWKFSCVQHNPQQTVLRQQWSLKPFLVRAKDYQEIKAQWDEILSESSFEIKISPSH
ncbi:transglutaminase domain-containing protein [Fibrobacterota bacterium]